MLLVLSAVPKSQLGKEANSQIQKLLEEREVDFMFATFKDVKIILTKQGAQCTVKGTDISSFTMMYVRFMKSHKPIAAILAKEVSDNGGQVIDQYLTQEGMLSGYKICSLYKYAKEGINIPRTVRAGGGSSEVLASFESDFSYPFIIKSLTGSQGKGVFLVTKRKDAINAIKEVFSAGYECIAQSYIKNLFEYRVLVLGGVAKVVEKKTRTKKGEFRNNVALGAIEQFLDMEEVPAGVVTIAEHAASVGSVDVAGVDVIYNEVDGSAFVLEVNPAPQMSVDISESNEVGELVDYLEICAKRT